MDFAHCHLCVVLEFRNLQKSLIILSFKGKKWNRDFFVVGFIFGSMQKEKSLWSCFAPDEILQLLSG